MVILSHLLFLCLKLQHFFSLFVNSIQSKSNQKQSQKMKADLGTKYSKILDDFELVMDRDWAGLRFTPRETETMFILTLHLKGYMRNIKAEMNEHKARILVSGQKSVHETFMVGSTVCKEGTTMRESRKAFKIPNEVISDQIKVSFNENEQNLIISMPNKVKGIRGISVEEAEEEEVDKRNYKSLQITTNGVEKMEEKEIEPPKIVEDKEEKPSGKEIPRGEREMEIGGKESERQDKTPGIVKPKEEENDDKELNQIEASRENKFEDKNQQARGKEELLERENENEIGQESALRNRLDEEACEGETEKKCKKPCVPMMVGSAFFVSVIVLVIHLMRNKNSYRKKKH